MLLVQLHNQLVVSTLYKSDDVTSSFKCQDYVLAFSFQKLLMHSPLLFTYLFIHKYTDSIAIYFGVFSFMFFWKRTSKMSEKLA